MFFPARNLPLGGNAPAMCPIPTAQQPSDCPASPSLVTGMSKVRPQSCLVQWDGDGMGFPWNGKRPAGLAALHSRASQVG